MAAASPSGTTPRPRAVRFRARAGTTSPRSSQAGGTERRSPGARSPAESREAALQRLQASAHDLAGRARVCKCHACLAQAQLLLPSRRCIAAPPATARDYSEQARRARLPALRRVIASKSARQAVREEREAEIAEVEQIKARVPTPPSPPPLASAGLPELRSRHRLGMPLRENAPPISKLLYAKSMASTDPRLHIRQGVDHAGAQQLFDQVAGEDWLLAEGDDREMSAARKRQISRKLEETNRRALGLPSPPPRTPTPEPPPKPAYMDTFAAMPHSKWSSVWKQSVVTAATWTRPTFSVHRARRQFEPADRAPTPEPEPEPEPKKKKRKKRKKRPSRFLKVDVSDLVRDRLMLRQVILSAVEDGDVDKEERREIAKILSRAGHTKARVERGKAALDDGVMDDDDRALLTSFVIRPPNFCPAAVQKLAQERAVVVLKC